MARGYGRGCRQSSHAEEIKISLDDPVDKELGLRTSSTKDLPVCGTQNWKSEITIWGIINNVH